MPVISKITGAPFRFWCQKILPAVYDDSLSYYELLCKVVDYLNKVMEDDINVVNLVNELEEFVNNYFNNLDVQQEINNKLDAMAEDGSLIAVIAPHLDPIIEDYEATLDADLAEYKETIDADVADFKSTVNDAIDAQDTDIANFKNTVNEQVTAQNTEIANFKSTVNTAVSEQDNDISVMQSQMSNFIDSYSDIQTFTDLYTATPTNGLHYINQTIDLSHPYTDYEELDIYWRYNSDEKVIRVKSADLLTDGAYISWYVDKSPDTGIPAPLYITMMKLVNGNATHTQLTLGVAYSEEWNGLAASDATRDEATTASEYTAGEVYKIVGVTYTTSAELTDIRVGYNGKTYANAGNAVRAQVDDLHDEVDKLNSVAYKYLDNLIDFGSIGNTWVQGSYDNPTIPYVCHTNPITLPVGQNKVYTYFSPERYLSELGYTGNGLVLVLYFDANNTYISSNSSSTEYPGPHEHTIPNNTAYIEIQLSTSVWSDSLTPEILDNVSLPFAYVGYTNIESTDIMPNRIPYPADNDSRITALENKVPDIYSDMGLLNNKIDNASIYVKTDSPEVLTQGGGYYKTDGTLFSPTSTEFLHYDLSVLPGEVYSIYGFFSRDSRFVEFIFFNSDNGVVSYEQATEDGLNTLIATVPAGAVKMGINSYGSHTPSCYKCVQKNTQDYITEYSNYWYGKKIVWYGTSIPNSGYPQRIGELTGATVYNESYGSSCARGGSYHAVSENDPMGWSDMQAIQVMLSLTLSQAEKQNIIDNWDTKWKYIMADPQTYDSSQVSNYLATSWDVRLSKYLTGGSVGQCDLYVFDHGYNDHVESSGFSDLSDVPTDSTDRTYWIGAMNFLIKKILEDNPRAHILIIGHYNNEGDQFNRGANYNQNYVCEAQKKLADMWGLTCVPTWELLGLSTQTITVGGTVKTMIAARYPDKLHPQSDLTGSETKRYAEALLPHIQMQR